MKLTILDRIILKRILPKKSDFVTLRVAREISKKLTFSTEELKKYKIRTVRNPDGSSQIVWDKNAHKQEADIKLVRIEREIIIKHLEELDVKKLATDNHLDLYDKIKLFHEALNNEEKKG